MSPRSALIAETIYYDDGTPKMKGAHLDGEMHGAWAWYRTDGSIMRTGEFDRGRQIGPWRTFHRSGRLVKETDFGHPPTSEKSLVRHG